MGNQICITKKNTSKNFIKSDTIISYQTSIRAWSAHKGAFNFFRKCMRVNLGSLGMFRPKLAPSLPTACSFLLWSTILFHVRLLSPNFSSTPNWSRVHVSTLCTMHCFGCRYFVSPPCRFDQFRTVQERVPNVAGVVSNMRTPLARVISIELASHFLSGRFFGFSQKRSKHQSSKLHRGIRKETDWNVFCLFKAIVYFMNPILFGNMFVMFVSNHRVLTQISTQIYQTTRLQWTFGLTTSCCEQDRFLRPWKKDGVCSSSQENVADISAKYIKIIYGKMKIWSDC